jgi:uracil-DNA glycosylase
MTVCLIGEGWGKEEAFQRKPFVGATGRELNRLLEEAGLLPPGSAATLDWRNRDLIFHEAGIHLTNVFNFQPPANQIEALCGPKWGELRPLRPGKYLREEFVPELDRLSAELRSWQPNLIIALGATALWFLTGSTAITKSRGTIFPSPFGKALATFHPAYLMRGEWRLRPVVVFDLIKAARERAFPEIRRPEREVFIPESVEDIEGLLPTLRAAARLSIDIETAGNQITCIGFAWSAQSAITIPIIDGIKSVWSLPDEQQIWRLIRKICEYPVPKVFQNGLFDLHFLWRRYGIRTANCADDPMLLSHALYPEVQKGLGFLGSIYTNEAAWKIMRPRTNKTLKREDE